MKRDFDWLKKIKDYTHYAYDNFRHRKLRSWLTMLGIFIGIAAVVSLVSLGQGLQDVINAQFAAIGSDKIMIMPGSSLASSVASQAAELKEGDLNIIRKTPGVKLADGMVYKVLQVGFKDEKKYTWVIGIPTTKEGIELFSTVNTFKAAQGRMLKQGDKYNIGVGYMMWHEDFFKKKVNIGSKITIDDKNFEVVGLTDRIGNNQDDSQVYIPMDVARDIMGVPERYDYLMAQSSDISDTANVAAAIEKNLRRYRNVKEGEEDFTVMSTDEMLKTYGNILTIIQAVVIGIACISLFVGGIGIMNTMYTAVLERTNEIGVMKAIGARNSDILQIFLIESGLIGLVGGAIGIALGIGFSSLVSFIANKVLNTIYFQASFSPFLIIGSLAFSFVVGSISGLMPAIQASRQKPVDALRYE